MYRIEYHTQEQLGTDEQTDAYFDTLDETLRTAEAIRQENRIFVEIKEVK